MAKDRKQIVTDILNGLGIKEFNVSMTNNGHYKIESPNLDRQVITSGSPSDFRSDLNLKSELRSQMNTSLRAVSGKGSYSDTEKKEVLRELVSKETERIDLLKKYSISNNTLIKWGIEFDIDTSGGRKTKYSIEIKNQALKKYDSGMGATQIGRAMNIEPKNVANWIAYYRKSGHFYKESAANVVKKIAKETLQNNISYINTGKEKAYDNDEFSAAINLLSNMPQIIKDLQAELKNKNAEIDDLKAKLAIVKEAIAL